MRGYGSHSYGDAFADVYDDWYPGVSDVGQTVAFVGELAGPGGSVLELGVGTGRLAIPLAASGLRVVGIDSSVAMLARLAAADPDGSVDSVNGDMVADLPDGPFDVALIAYNTIFNLVGDGEQQRCFHEVAARLAPGGAFVVEAFVPDESLADGDDVTVRSMTADSVVLMVTRRDVGSQQAEGHFVELNQGEPVRLRPWSVRWATVAQLDTMAARAGFDVESRFRDVGREPFDGTERHVTVYRLSQNAVGSTRRSPANRG